MGERRVAMHTSCQVRRLLGIGLLAILVFFCSRSTSPVYADDCGTPGCAPAGDLAFDQEDIDFILQQIKFAERHAAGEDLLDILPNASIPLGLRTVDGTFNNLIPGQEGFGAADLEFAQSADRVFGMLTFQAFPVMKM